MMSANSKVQLTVINGTSTALNPLFAPYSNELYTHKLCKVLHILPHSVIKWALQNMHYEFVGPYPDKSLMLHRIVEVNEANIKTLVKEMIVRGYL